MLLDKKTIGERIAIARKCRGCSHKTLLALSKQAGKDKFSCNAMSEFERGSRPMSQEYIDLVVDILHLSKNWIMTGEGPIGALKEDIERYKTNKYDFSAIDGKLQLQSFYGYLLTDDELVQCAINDAVDKDIVNKIVRIFGGDTWYFNESLVYTLIPKGEPIPKHIGKKWNTLSSVFKPAIWEKAKGQFTAGMTLEECVRIYMTISVKRSEEKASDCANYSDFERLVTSISHPSIERKIDNDNTKTFDFIRISVALPKYIYSKEELTMEIKANIKEITQLVIRKIETSSAFKRYDIPVDFLKISRCVIRPDYTLEYLFTLKTAA